VVATPAAGRWPVHRQHTRQILINLVGNAARHSPGTILLGARLQAGRLRLAVADEGGPNPLLAQALRRRTPPDGDNGLGLWLVRHFVTAHGGRVRARRGRAGGLVMEVVLPRYRPRPSGGPGWPRRAIVRGHTGDMRVALVSRTVVLVGWLLAVLWHGIREPAGIVVAIALLAVWAAAFARDSRKSAWHLRSASPPAS
jgi:hypothetical protein